jgi:glucose-6-phosphate isomerase
MNPLDAWNSYHRSVCRVPEIGLELDISRMHCNDEFLAAMNTPIMRAMDAMTAIESGAFANVDEHRQVGHYWLRAPQLAPDPAIAEEIRRSQQGVIQFAEDVYNEVVSPERGDGFYVVLVIGIGGSALGPQLLADALGTHQDRMLIRFIDNTDPDGVDRILAEMDELLAQTLTIVCSKSGGTKETRNAMLEVAHAYKLAGLNFARHAVAVTCEGSALHRQAIHERWLRTFPIWDFVGGRTSVTSAVGLLPSALQGIDVAELLEGARLCDEITRRRDPAANPAAMLALMWHLVGDGHGSRNMVVLPYSDRLALFGKFLQQLVMESIGKATDRKGNRVNQGLTLFGNKGSTDQHSFVQQLREGPDDFFVTFVNVLRGRNGPSIKVEDDVTTGDYLHAFHLGTREALTQAGRRSMTITLDELGPRTLGALIALYERAVGLYAELIDINAYHQPGVEAGKNAADVVIDMQRRLLAYLRKNPNGRFTALQLADAIGEPAAVESVHHLLRYIAQNRDHGVIAVEGPTPWERRYGSA